MESFQRQENCGAILQREKLKEGTFAVNSQEVCAHLGAEQEAENVDLKPVKGSCLRKDILAKLDRPQEAS